ncbi:MAG TPA: hypothetical protein VM925_07105, partial [Labilithrix sp.]|nr:hypothetical protein [Labilithrix sp.]
MSFSSFVLFSNAQHAITKEWLESVVPPRTSVRAIPLPNCFMLNDADDRSAISIQTLDEGRRKIAIASLRELVRRPSKELLRDLRERPLIVEVEIVRGGQTPNHPIVRPIVEALNAIVELDSELYDSDLVGLSSTFPLRKSGAPPYDPASVIDFRTFAFNDFFWVGKLDV